MPGKCTGVSGQLHERRKYVNLRQQQYALDVKWSNVKFKRSQWMNAILKLKGGLHIVLTSIVAHFVVVFVERNWDK